MEVSRRTNERRAARVRRGQILVVSQHCPFRINGVEIGTGPWSPPQGSGWDLEMGTIPPSPSPHPAPTLTTRHPPTHGRQHRTRTRHAPVPLRTPPPTVGQKGPPNARRRWCPSVKRHRITHRGVRAFGLTHRRHPHVPSAVATGHVLRPDVHGAAAEPAPRHDVPDRGP